MCFIPSAFSRNAYAFLTTLRVLLGILVSYEIYDILSSFYFFHFILASITL